MKPVVLRVAANSVVLAVITGAFITLSCAAQDIQPYRAQEVKPYQADPVRPAGTRFSVFGLRCTSARCETAPDDAVDLPSIFISGNAGSVGGGVPAQLMIFEDSGRLVRKDYLTIGPDRSFRTSIRLGQLPPGAYKFGIVTADRSDTVIAAGSFRVAAEADAPAPSRKRGFAGVLEKLSESSSTREPATPTAARPADSGNSIFFRTFGLAIPGVVYSTDNYATNTRTTTIASGVVTKSAVCVNADGTYVWNSAWDGKVIRGAWRREGGGLTLISGQSGHDWRLDRLAQPLGKAIVVLYDSSTQYHGTPLD